jgi:DNA-binding MarR family transcriptional regulator
MHVGKDVAADCERFLDLIRRLRLQVTPRLTDALVKQSLTGSQYNALVVLKGTGETTMGTLSKRLRVTMAASTNLVDRLLEAGFVERQHSETDRRVVNVKLTALGEKTVAESTEGFVKYVSEILCRIPAEERKVFFATYARIVDIAENIGAPKGAGSVDA